MEKMFLTCTELDTPNMPYITIPFERASNIYHMGYVLGSSIGSALVIVNRTHELFFLDVNQSLPAVEGQHAFANIQLFTFL